ncbi:sugar phosphate isomerase/epimerase [Akkermansiaceae bacterium]|nr:sugar phosphate isomerase/epimerase [Akkermansiaceae bacterium]
MNRRHFSQLSLATLATSAAFADHHGAKKGEPFKAKFAPHPGLIPTGPGRKDDYIEQLQFAYDLGFRAWEDNGFFGQKPETQEKVAAFMKEKGMEFGVAVISNGKGAMFNKPTEDQTSKIKKDLLKGVEVAKRTGQTNMTFLAGVRDESMSREDQIKASVDTMKMCCDLVEEQGIILALEPLSHPIGGKQPLLRSFADGHLLAKLVNRKSCKLLADFFHEGQIGNGDKLVANAEATWDQVSYIQYGASPGRKEPGTGNLDYTAVTKFLRSKNFTGVIGMEHGASKKGKEGLDALMAAYRKIDA